MGKSNINKLYKDLAWYFSGNIVPLLIAVIKSPIFTRHYSPVEYGNYTIVTVTFSILSLVLFTSISSCIWRFYNQYKLKSRLSSFFGMLIVFYGASIALLGLISITWFRLSIGEAFHNLILISFIQFVSNEIILIFMIILKLEKKSGSYTILNSARIVLTFIVLLLFAFTYNMGIESLIMSAVIINIIFLLSFIITTYKTINFSFDFKKNEYKELLNFGLISILIKLGLTLLVSSDRYFIKIFDSIENVGIYNQVYNIGQISLDSLIIVFFSSISPILNEHLTLNTERCSKLIRRHLKIYIQYFTPLLVYLIMYYETIVTILLGPEFQSGGSILPFIFISSYIYGLTTFFELKLKFKNRMKLLLFGIITALLVNCLLNAILIPEYGYKSAAITTLIGYSILFLTYWFKNSFNYFRYQSNNKHFLIIAAILIVESIIHFYLSKFGVIEPTIVHTLIEGSVFAVVYLLIIYRYNKKKIGTTIIQ